MLILLACAMLAHVGAYATICRHILDCQRYMIDRALEANRVISEIRNHAYGNISENSDPNLTDASTEPEVVMK